MDGPAEVSQLRAPKRPYPEEEEETQEVCLFIIGILPNFHTQKCKETQTSSTLGWACELQVVLMLHVTDVCVSEVSHHENDQQNFICGAHYKDKYSKYEPCYAE